MRRGAKPKPTELKKIAGTWRRDRAPARPEPLAPGLIQAPPAHFSARQREIWTETLANAPRQLWRRADVGMVAGYVVGLSLLETANAMQAEIDKGNLRPLLIVGHNNVIMPSPYLRVIRLALEMIARFGAELGMSPSARSRLSVDETISQPGENWADFDALLEKAANRG
jgi:P27 family predicted phage terminase small subunit